MWSRRTLLLGAATALLPGCGFRPLYGRDSGADSTADVSRALAGIRVDPIADRAGQYLRNQLLDLMTPRGRPRRPRHALRVDLREIIQELAIARNAFATRANLRLTATFVLTDLASGKTLVSDTDTVIGSYNILTSDYATLIEQKDARERASRELAGLIRTRIALYFSDPGS